jgi:hypothetical protein
MELRHLFVFLEQDGVEEDRFGCAALGRDGMQKGTSIIPDERPLLM